MGRQTYGCLQVSGVWGVGGVDEDVEGGGIVLEKYEREREGERSASKADAIVLLHSPNLLHTVLLCTLHPPMPPLEAVRTA